MWQKSVPRSVFSVKLRSVTGTVRRSPWRTNLGIAGSTISSFRATTVVSSRPLSIPFVCAKAVKFHDVRRCGRVKDNVAMPFSSVCKAGRKNAVSAKFVRAWPPPAVAPASATSVADSGCAASSALSALTEISYSRFMLPLLRVAALAMSTCPFPCRRIEPNFLTA